MYEVITWRGQYAVGRDAGRRFFYESLHPTRKQAEHAAQLLQLHAADNPLPVVCGSMVVRMWRMVPGDRWCVDRLLDGVWELVRSYPTRRDAEQRITALTTKRKAKGKGVATPAAQQPSKRVPSEPAKAKEAPFVPIGYVPIMQRAATDNSNTVSAA
jgi:hypothetical protein